MGICFLIQSFKSPIAQFYCDLANYYLYHKNNLPECLHCLDRALALSRSTVHRGLQNSPLIYLAEVEATIGDCVKSRQHAQEAQRTAVLEASSYHEGLALVTQAKCCVVLGDYKEAVLLLHRARELLRLCGVFGGTVHNTINNWEATARGGKSEYAEALAICQQAIDNPPDQGGPDMLAFSLFNIASSYVSIGSATPDVHKILEKASKMFQSTQYIPGLAHCKSLLAELNLRDGNLSLAKSQFMECLSSMRGRDCLVVSYCLERLADIHQWRRAGANWTSTWAFVYLVDANKSRRKLEIHRALQFLGDVFLLQGDQCTARVLFTVALEGFTHMDVNQGRADCMLRLGDLSQQEGNSEQAEALWREARPLFERSLQAKDVYQIDSRLATSDDAFTAATGRISAYLEAFHRPPYAKMQMED